MTTTSTTTGRDSGRTSRDLPGNSLLSGERQPRGNGLQLRPTRSWGLVTLAALLVLGMGLVVAAWGLHSGQKQSVLEVGAPVAKGQVLQRSDLVSVSVAGVPGAIAIGDLSLVVGKSAAVDLVRGQILTSSMVTGTPVPGPGQAVVGLSLDPSFVPGAGLDAGDQVEVLAVPGGNDDGSQPGASDPTGATALDVPTVLAKTAQVYTVAGSSTAGGQVLVTLIVDSADAGRVAAYSTQNRVAIVETAPAAASSDSANTDNSPRPGSSAAGESGSSAGGR